MKNHDALAADLFYGGYNCAQAVFCAFAEETGMTRDEAARLASSFGGGMGRLREVCGAVSGALLALGALRGYADPDSPEAKKAHYALVQEFARRFREQNGSIVCRELLANVKTVPGGEPEPRTPEFYRRRPCPELIRLAAAIADELLNDTEPEKEESV